MRRLTNRDERNIASQLRSPSLTREEKWGLLYGLEVLGYITRTTRDMLIDNVDMLDEGVQITEETFWKLLKLAESRGL